MKINEILECEECHTTKGRIYGKGGKYSKNLCAKHRWQLRIHGKALDRTRNSPNEFIVKDDVVEIVLYNSCNTESGRALVDIKHYDMVIRHKWGMTSGYVIDKTNGANVLLHRIITNAPEDMVVDHINHNTLDNRDNNLRVCTRSENQCNQIIKTNNTSGHKGINWDKRRSKWVVRISVNNHRVQIGYFNDISDAIIARKAADVKYHGEFAYILDNY